MRKRVKKVQLKPVKFREIWEIKPVTRIKPSSKVYNRKRSRPQDAGE
jgi:hypothetical protein